MTLAVIMPVLNEGADLARRLQSLQALRARGVQLLVVDGGSTDGSTAAAHALADRVLVAPRGRAAQMNAGACAARADTLLFLHADTELPPQADALVAQAMQAGHAWGRFDVRIQGQHPLLPVVAALMNVRSRITGIATGDQALFVRRAVFQAAGGFAPQPLMEDVDLCRRLRRVGAPACLSARVTTSGRRWDQHGLWRTIVLMWRLRAAYFLGAEPQALAARYGYNGRAPAAVAVLAKAPVPGLAKTRLIPALGAAGAARAQRGFALQTLITARAAATGPVILWCAPAVQHRFFSALAARHGVACVPQPGGDLGMRMGEVMHRHFAGVRGMPLLIVGTDCPVLTPQVLQQAADVLQHHDAVLIPAEDGGYVLIGMSRPLPLVFEGIDWSTARVMAQTRERLLAAGARWQEMPPLWDVDEPADWARLQHQRQGETH